jgi:hypothetical protein
MVLGRLSEREIGMTHDRDRRGDSDGEETLALLRFGIAKRVIHVCAHMTSPEFDAMVAAMARVQHKYEVLGCTTFGRPPTA